MKKRGFTLIELLAVIVVLAIIALIAIRVITGVVEKTRKGAAKNSALNYVRAIELKIATDSLSGIKLNDSYCYTIN